jgi:MYXO-CTERM domain-containing protein
MKPLLTNTALTFALAASILFISNARSYGQIIEVTPSDMNGWAFGSFSTTSDPVNPADITQLVNGPATPPLGSGSAELATAAGSGGDAVFVESSVLDGVKLSNLTSFSYSTYVTTNNGQQFPFLKLTVDTDPGQADNTIDAIIFEPPYQTPSTGDPSITPGQEATALNTWQSWNVLSGDIYADSAAAPGTGGESFADYLAANPNATIETDPTAGYDSIRITSGEGDPSDNFVGYVDDVSLGFKNGNGGTTNETFDFEDAPEPATWALALAGIGALALVRRARSTEARS